MAVMAIYRSDRISPEAYAAFRARVPLSPAPTGALIHLYGHRDGELCVVEAWEDRDQLNRFLADTVAPAMEAAGLEPATPEIFEMETAAFAPPARRFASELA
ncbi:hypothetical protein [Phenylobacterium sp.]|uniref:hypothetical protein n=1 Tax=Phenylobacterium sp. TaxID=1871053 RepID=UPI002810EB04|nr:hypothetical protein [Phenylobacterium sp.]